MSSEDLKNKCLNELTKEFDDLVTTNKMNINSLENIMINSIDNYKKELKTHIEELLKCHINEKELISKKNENGKKKDSN